MKIRSIIVAAAAALATSVAFANTPAPKPAQPQPVPRAESVVEELVAGMRELLRAAAPEIALPKLEVKLPALDARR
jgi:hypothetical protein